MKLLHLPRRAGKTTTLIRMSAESGGIIVCFSRHEVKRIKEIANELKLNIPNPITFNEVLNGRLRGLNRPTLLVDNVEIMLNSLFGNVEIGAITITDED